MRNKPIDQLLTGHKLTKNDGKLSLRTPVRQTTPKNGHKLLYYRRVLVPTVPQSFYLTIFKVDFLGKFR